MNRHALATVLFDEAVLSFPDASLIAIVCSSTGQIIVTTQPFHYTAAIIKRYQFLEGLYGN